MHRIFGDQRHKTKKQREKKSLRTSGSLQARSQLTKFFLSFRQAYLPVQVTIMAQGRKMTAAQKAAAKAAREADARSATAASLTEEELTALLKTKRDAAAAAAAKEAADAEAARAAQEAEEAAAPTGGRAAAEATAPAATAAAPAGGDSEAAEARMCQKLFAMIRDSGLLPTAPGTPAAVGGPERPAAERSPEPLQPSTSEEDQVINLYRGALPQAASTTSSTPLLAQARQDLAAARRESGGGSQQGAHSPAARGQDRRAPAHVLRRPRGPGRDGAAGWLLWRR